MWIESPISGIKSQIKSKCLKSNCYEPTQIKSSSCSNCDLNQLAICIYLPLSAHRIHCKRFWARHWYRLTRRYSASFPERTDTVWITVGQSFKAHTGLVYNSLFVTAGNERRIMHCVTVSFSNINHFRHCKALMVTSSTYASIATEEFTITKQ